MKIVGLRDDQSVGDLIAEVERGGKFVIYQYNISALVVSFKRSSNIYYVPPGRGRFGKGVPFTLLALLVGPWGFPWGLIWTVESIFVNLGGGRDVTAAVMEGIAGSASAGAAEPHPFRKITVNDR